MNISSEMLCHTHPCHVQQHSYNEKQTPGEIPTMETEIAYSAKAVRFDFSSMLQTSTSFRYDLSRVKVPFVRQDRIKELDSQSFLKPGSGLLQGF